MGGNLFPPIFLCSKITGASFYPSSRRHVTMISTRIVLLLSSIVAIAFCQFVILAQVQSSPTTSTVEIHGQVRFAEGGAPAANVVVRLESYDGGGSISEAFTDRLGKFRFTGLPPAQYSVRVRQSGYRDAQQNSRHDDDHEWLGDASALARCGSTSTTTSVAGSIDANVPAAAQKEFDKGAAALAEGGKEKTEFAVRCFEKAVSIYPKFVEARLKLGHCAHGSGAVGEGGEGVVSDDRSGSRRRSMRFSRWVRFICVRTRSLMLRRCWCRDLRFRMQSYLGHLNLARVYWEKRAQIKDLAQAKPALEKSYEEVKRALTLNPELAGCAFAERQSAPARLTHRRRTRRIRRIPAPRTQRPLRRRDAHAGGED